MAASILPDIEMIFWKSIPPLMFFLMTSIMEGLPNTVLEAMAMNVPVVSTDVAGVPELV